jgi:hypothetical protein
LRRRRSCPFVGCSGFVRACEFSSGWRVVYLAALQGVDVGGLRYVVVCEPHGSLVGVRSLRLALLSCRSGDFCSLCSRR